MSSSDTLTESDKTTKTFYPPLPSQCCICFFKSDGTREFLDFQMSLDFYGAVLICSECVAPVAQLFGYTKNEKIEANAEVISDLRDTIEKLENDNAELSGTLDSLFSLRPDLEPGRVSSDENASEVAESDHLQLELPIDDDAKPATGGGLEIVLGTGNSKS